ncbi:multiple sugar transport system permease protein [Lentzea albidocapillata subsp. violacea]|uniref:Multiple sugar transport system permease protein n=1 Tax=Lentzea albidocapillata subsp. violacea TaxID=128104 RepID=A0A1G8YJS6_9PSEU|nr:carbohydrate ABC transporter permease [Lentzea albidocapillata]SDK03092.1 multiple sugar transport system permease protein [Lentzea albidocapillata subsp. violacea]
MSAVSTDTRSRDAVAPAVSRGPARRNACRRPSGVAARVAWTVVLGLFLTFFMLPVVWLVLAPTRTDSDIIRGDGLSFGSWENFATAWQRVFAYQDGALLTWLTNSAVYAFGALAITLVTAIPAGYGLAVMRFRGRKLLLVTTLISMLMPAAALVLPLYLELNAVGLAGSIWSVILPLSFFPFGVYLTYIYYSTNLPPDVLAAARIDGCTEWQAFRHIALPLAKPVVALVLFFSFVANWNNYFLPFVMLPSDTLYPAQVGLTNMLTASPVFNTSSGIIDIRRPELALAALVTILPILVIFLVSQRALVSGMLAGASKE